MKGKAKYITSSLVAVVAIFCVGLVVNAFSNELAIESISYTSQRSTHDIKEDGWIYVFEINYAENEKDNNLYIFDGYNLKYKKLDGFYVPVIDKETGKEIDRVTPNYITLSISETHKKEIVKIGDFFNKKQFVQKITNDDLKDLEVSNFDKDYLVSMFNKAIEAELKTTAGEYLENSFIDKVNIKSTDKNMVGEWQVSYLIDYGYIYDVNIEFINEDGTYLFDNIKNTKVISSEAELFNNIENLEKEIVKTQSFDSIVSKTLKSKNTTINSDIDSLFDTLVKRINE